MADEPRASFPHRAARRLFEARLFWAGRAAALALVTAVAAVADALDLEGPDGAYLLWAFALAAALITAFAGAALGWARERLGPEAALDGLGAEDARVGPLGRGAALAAGWVSSATLVGLAGALYAYGQDGFAFLFGWIAGFLLLAGWMAPALRAAGAATASGYLGRRFGEPVVSLAAGAAGVAAFGLLAAQISAAGLVTARFLGASLPLAVGLAGLVVAAGAFAERGGGALRAGASAFAALLLAYLAPAAWISWSFGHGPAPQAGYLAALEEIAGLERALAATGAGFATEHLAFGERFTTFELALVALTLALGVAAQPHLAQAARTAPSAAEGRLTASIGFALILAATLVAPAYAAYAKLSAALFFAETGGAASVVDTPDWAYRWGGIDQARLLTICGEPAPTEAAVERACAAAGRAAGFGADQLRVDPDAVVFAAAEMSGAPWALIGLLGAGVLTAALATGVAIARALGASFGRELFVRTVRLGATIDEERRAARTAGPVIVAAATLWAATRPADVLTMVVWSFSISAAALFPALALGLWWRRARPGGAAVGVVVGLVTVLFLQISGSIGFDGAPGTGDERRWFGLDPLAAGAVGAAVGAAAMAVASLVVGPGAPGDQSQSRRMGTKGRSASGMG